MVAIPPNSCTIPECSKPIKRRSLCYSHYMKWWRYGDPTWTQPKRRRDLSSKRFGSVVVIAEADPGHWLCRCDCGRETRVRAWSLTSGGTTTCGDGPTHHRAEMVSYSAAHGRAYRDKGRAKDHPCSDCGEPARHWSYTHADPDEMVDDKGCAYSLDPDHYVPRCVPCHKRFDLDRIDAREVADG